MVFSRAVPLLSVMAGLALGACGDGGDGGDPFGGDSSGVGGTPGGTGTTGAPVGTTGQGTGTTGTVVGTTGGDSGATGTTGTTGTAGTAGDGAGIAPPTGTTGGNTGGIGTDSGTSASGGVVDTSGDTGVAPQACGSKPGAKRGKVVETITAGGLQRRFIYYAPEGLDPNVPVPLVISPHGVLMSDESMYNLTGFKELADAEGFVVIFPQGGEVPWNVGQGITGAGAFVGGNRDDQAFVDAMIEYVAEDRCLDREHIFVSGFSMGGYFSNEIACLRSDIAGVAPHSGGTHDLSNCPGSIKPVLILHGDIDWLITYAENGVRARDRWVQRNGCSTESDSVPVNKGTCEYYRDCPVGGQVAMCTFNGLDHLWAGGNPSLFSDPSYDDASRIAWEFWKEYAW